MLELAEINQAIKQTAKSHLTWRSDRQLPAFAWREYRAILAAHLPLHGWRWVEAAYNDANGLNWRVMEMGREFKTDGPVHFVENDWLREPFRTVHHAMGELEQAWVTSAADSATRATRPSRSLRREFGSRVAMTRRRL